MSACLSIPKSIKNSFTYCYDGKYTGIDTLINIDGYYLAISIKENIKAIGGFLDARLGRCIDTTYTRIMFYNNGLMVYNMADIYYNYIKKEHLRKDVASFLQDFSENSEAVGANDFYGNDWGRYIVCGDTIKVQRAHKSTSLNDAWVLREIWYKIIDKNTILCIDYFRLPTTTVPQVSRGENYLMNFIPIPAKPKPDKSWILKEKWFWCNESDWKAYMDSLKQEKSKKK